MRRSRLMVDVGLAGQREQFRAQLRAMFGEGFLELIQEPPDVQIGERVLYRLAGWHRQPEGVWPRQFVNVDRNANCRLFRIAGLGTRWADAKYSFRAAIPPRIACAADRRSVGV